MVDTKAIRDKVTRYPGEADNYMVFMLLDEIERFYAGAGITQLTMDEYQQSGVVKLLAYLRELRALVGVQEAESFVQRIEGYMGIAKELMSKYCGEWIDTLGKSEKDYLIDTHLGGHL